MQDIFQTIYEILAAQRNEGKTQSEMSRESGVAQSRICRLLDSRNGVTNIKRLGLETFFKLFPNARIVFDDRRTIGDVTNNSGQVVNGDVTAPLPPPPSARAAEDAVIARIMASDDLDAETKVKLYTLLQRKP